MKRLTYAVPSLILPILSVVFFSACSFTRVDSEEQYVPRECDWYAALSLLPEGRAEIHPIRSPEIEVSRDSFHCYLTPTSQSEIDAIADRLAVSSDAEHVAVFCRLYGEKTSFFHADVIVDPSVNEALERRQVFKLFDGRYKAYELAVTCEQSSVIARSQ